MASITATNRSGTGRGDPPTLAGRGALQPLRRRRMRFVISGSLFLLGFNLLQPILSVSTRLLDGPAFGGLTWGWVYAFAQFVVPLAVLHLYLHETRQHDAAVQALNDVRQAQSARREVDRG